MSKIRCLDCNDIIQSNYRNDFVRCSCGNSFVDGGDSYTRAGGNIVFLGDQIESEKAFNLVTRQRFKEDGRKLERERILELLKKQRMCEHSPECDGEVNIYDSIKDNFGIDLEELINRKEEK